jgi:hypothetical protein
MRTPDRGTQRREPRQTCAGDGDRRPTSTLSRVGANHLRRIPRRASIQFQVPRIVPKRPSGPQESNWHSTFSPCSARALRTGGATSVSATPTATAAGHDCARRRGAQPPSRRARAPCYLPTHENKPLPAIASHNLPVCGLEIGVQPAVSGISSSLHHFDHAAGS